ncbi:MAG TPA: ATP-binding protein [bacterium]|nr:ATP-binding protein [bacterium]
MNKFLLFLLPFLISLILVSAANIYIGKLFPEKQDDIELFYMPGYFAINEIEVLDSYINRASSLEEYLIFKNSIIDSARKIVRNSEIVAKNCDETVSVRLKHFTGSISQNIEQILPEELNEEIWKASLLKIKGESWKLKDIVQHGLRKKKEETQLYDNIRLINLKKWMLFVSTFFIVITAFLTGLAVYYFNKTSKISRSAENIKKINAILSDESGEVQRKLQREQILSKRKSALLDTIPIGIFSSDMNGTLSYINKKMFEWFNVSEDSAGDSVETVLLSMGVEDVKNGKFIFNGNIYWIFVSEISRENFYFVRNITEQEELARKLLDSERLVSIGEMASRITHEIRNPLSTIKLNSEYLAENVVELDDSQISASLELIVKEVVRLESITDKYMDMVRYRNNDESEVLTVLPVDLLQLISFHMPEFDKRNIEISVEKCEGCTVSITLSSFKEIMLNLFKNAWEELSEGGVVLINGNIAENKIVLKIEDSGRGIPESEREAVFKNFFTKKPGGTGIGLSHSRKLAVEAGGKLSATDSKIGGACMVLELPLKTTDL